MTGEDDPQVSIEDDELEDNVDELALTELLLDFGDLGIVLNTTEGMSPTPMHSAGDPAVRASPLIRP